MKRTQSTPEPDKKNDLTWGKAPQPNRVLAEPATIAACARDYAGAADVRATMADQIRQAR